MTTNPNPVGYDSNLPAAVDAEKTILGAILIDNAFHSAAAEKLEPDDFSLDSHRRIFQRMGTLLTERRPIDIVTLSNELSRYKEVESVGGVAYLASLTEGLPRRPVIDEYVRIVKDKSQLRRLMLICSQAIARAADQTESAIDVTAEVAEQVQRMAEQGIGSPLQTFGDYVSASYPSMDDVFRQSARSQGLPSGIRELDALTCGWQRKDLIIVAARPSLGKTAVATSFARKAAIELDQTVAFFSLEMSKAALFNRLISACSTVTLTEIREGRWSEVNRRYAIDAIEQIVSAPLYIDDQKGQTVRSMQAKAARLKSTTGHLDLVVIDQLNHVLPPAGSEKYGQRRVDIGFITRGLKAMADALDVPVMVLHQLSRENEKRDDKLPRLSDLRECVTGDTTVLLTNGRRVPIADLVGQEPEVWAVDQSQKIVRARAQAVWEVGKREVFELRLASGKKMRATAKHKVLCGSGEYKEMSEIGRGERVALARVIPEPNSQRIWQDTDLDLLGHLVGDGSYLSGQPLRYTTASEENSSLVWKAAEILGSSVKRYKGRGKWHQLLISNNGNRWHSSGVGAWLKHLGIFGQRSYEKRLPPEVFELQWGQIAILLRALWATDGCINVGKSDAVIFSTSSQGLAHDVAALLLRAAIVCRVRAVPHKTARTMYCVEIRGTVLIQRFIRSVGAFGPRVNAARRMLDKLSLRISNTNIDTLPPIIFERVRRLMRVQGISQREMTAMRGTSYGGSSHFRFAPSRAIAAEYGRLLNDSTILNWANSDLFWDRVTDIVPAGSERVFDLTVPGPNSWLADGIVTHNSGDVEQDADVVIFPHRDSYYEKSKEGREGREAVMMVAKQRNGPTGTAKCEFIAERGVWQDQEREAGLWTASTP